MSNILNNMGIGRQTKLLIDKSRTDYYSGEPERKIPISIIYPTKESGNSKYKDIYFPKTEMLNEIYAEGRTDRVKILDDLEVEFINNAPSDLSKKKLPVVIFSHGLTADRDFYMFLVIPLVKQGFIVVDTGHLYDTDFTLLPDGSVVKMKEGLLAMSKPEERYAQIKCRADDIKFVADSLAELNESSEFEGMFDLDKVSVAGHSLGGMTAVFAMEHPLIKAGVILDAALAYFDSDNLDTKATANKRLLNIRRDKVDYGERIKVKLEKSVNKSAENFKKAVMKEHEMALIEETNTKKMYEAFNSKPQDFIYMDDTVHLTFTDWFTLLPDLEVEGNTKVSKAHPIIAELAINFLEEYLSGLNKGYSDIMLNEKYTDIHIQKNIL